MENPALVPEGSPESWRRPFLNAVMEIDWRGSPQDLLQRLKQIEAEIGREPAPRWAPRAIDLDLLSFGDQTVTESDLRVPHMDLWNRQFVLCPLKHLAASWKIPGQNQTALQRSRSLPQPLPLWMEILNITPDSFSDGGSLATPERLMARLNACDAENTHILDIGAESTRPGAKSLTPELEWKRLAPALEATLERFRHLLFRPWISVDTYHPQTAAQAAALGVDIINDVSGLSDDAMLEVLRHSSCQYVLMHALTVPANPSVRMESVDPVADIHQWAREKLEQLQSAGVALDRVIFDPGIGFGKSPEQSFLILRQARRFLDLPVRVLIGHSRKSALSRFGDWPAAERDFETVGISLQLAESGVDLVRVHAAEMHHRTFRALREVQ